MRSWYNKNAMVPENKSHFRGILWFILDLFIGYRHIALPVGNI